jgi:pimeloyl-ACP methyl ester carboxylesterase
MPRDLRRPMLARWRRGRADLPAVVFVPGFLTDHGLVGPDARNFLEGWRLVLRSAFAERDVSIFALHWPAFTLADFGILYDDDDAGPWNRFVGTTAAALPAAGATLLALRAVMPSLTRRVPLGGVALAGALTVGGPALVGALAAGRARRRWRRAVRRADAIAGLLAAIPERARQEVVLIGHSLGGRMVLQAAARRASRQRPFAAVLAMAVGARADELPLEQASAGSRRAPEIAWSRHDRALAGLYRAFEGSWAEALGRVGPPPGITGCLGVDVSEVGGVALQHLAYERHFERVLQQTAMYGDRSLWG